MMKRTIILFTSLIILLLSFSICGAGCGAAIESPSSIFGFDDESAEETSFSDLPPEFDVIAEAWHMLSEEHIDKDNLDAKALSEGAVKGMMEALDDPYSYYVTSEAYRLEKNYIKGKYQGIGAHVGIRDGQLTIIAPIAGSPAEKAGIKAQDIILEVNGELTSKMSLVESVLKIQGPEGTPVNLLVFHKGESEPVEIVVIRKEIKLETVIWKMHGNVAYIRITEFTASTGNDFRAALEDVLSNGASGIVLDLRNNPGGLLSAAIDVTSQFLSSGIVVEVVDSQGGHRQLSVNPGGVATDLPLIVLVNSGSASGSEIVAGALQDHGRAEIAGSQTFGKGSVQTIRNLKDDSAVHLTMARWFTPSGRPIDSVGLEPDFVLDMEGDDLIIWAIERLDSQISAGCLPARV